MSNPNLINLIDLLKYPLEHPDWMFWGNKVSTDGGASWIKTDRLASYQSALDWATQNASSLASLLDPPRLDDEEPPRDDDDERRDDDPPLEDDPSDS